MADNQVRLQNEASVRAGEGQQQQQHLNQHQGQHQQRQQYDRSTSGDSRAGFEEYWREEKESERAGRLQFVNEGPPYHHQSSSSPLDHQSQQLSGEGEGGEQERQGSCEYFVSFSFILLFFFFCGKICVLQSCGDKCQECLPSSRLILDSTCARPISYFYFYLFSYSPPARC